MSDAVGDRLGSFELARRGEELRLQERLVESPPIDAGGPAPEEAPKKHACVLVVDDRPAAVHLLEALLEEVDIRVHVAHGVLSALAGLEDHLPSLILLDVRMPGVDGLEVCRMLKRLPETSHIPVGIVTSLDREDIERPAAESGADFVLLKPVDRHELVEVVLPWLGLL